MKKINYVLILSIFFTLIFTTFSFSYNSPQGFDKTKPYIVRKFPTGEVLINQIIASNGYFYMNTNKSAIKWSSDMNQWHIFPNGSVQFNSNVGTTGFIPSSDISLIIDMNTPVYNDTSKTTIHLQSIQYIPPIPNEHFFDWQSWKEGQTNEYDISIVSPIQKSPTINHFAEILVHIKKNSLVKLGTPPMADRVIVNGQQFSTSSLKVDTISSSYWSGSATYKFYIPLVLDSNTIDIIWDIKQTHIAAHFKEGVRAHVWRYEPPTNIQPGQKHPVTGEIFYPIDDINNPHNQLYKYNNQSGVPNRNEYDSSYEGTIKYYFDTLLYWITSPIRIIVDGFKMIGEQIATIQSDLSASSELLKVLFTWMPIQLQFLIWTSVILVVVMKFIGR